MKTLNHKLSEQIVFNKKLIEVLNTNSLYNFYPELKQIANNWVINFVEPESNKEPEKGSNKESKRFKDREEVLPEILRSFPAYLSKKLTKKIVIREVKVAVQVELNELIKIDQKLPQKVIKFYDDILTFFGNIEDAVFTGPIEFVESIGNNCLVNQYLLIKKTNTVFFSSKDDLVDFFAYYMRTFVSRSIIEEWSYLKKIMKQVNKQTLGKAYHVADYRIEAAILENSSSDFYLDLWSKINKPIVVSTSTIDKAICDRNVEIKKLEDKISKESDIEKHKRYVVSISKINKLYDGIIALFDDMLDCSFSNSLDFVHEIFKKRGHNFLLNSELMSILKTYFFESMGPICAHYAKRLDNNYKNAQKETNRIQFYDDFEERYEFNYVCKMKTPHQEIEINDLLDNIKKIRLQKNEKINTETWAIIIAKYYNGLTFKEIAHNYNIKTNTAEVRASKALELLKSKLTQCKNLK